MKKFGSIKERGIPLQKMSFLMLIVAIVSSGILFYAMYRTTTVYNHTHEMTQQLVTWHSQSSELQVASDYLTEQIRCFAVTGNKQCLDKYFEEAELTKRRENALDSLKDNPNNAEAYQELSLAMDGSLHLMEVEYYAARLTVEAKGYDLSEYPRIIQDTKLTEADSLLSADEKREKAREILFDDNYHAQKAYISSHMNACLDGILKELDEEQRMSAKSLKYQVFWEHAMTFLLIGVFFLIVALTNHLVLMPLRYAVNRIRDEQDIPLRGAYEIRFLAKTYNLMYQINLEKKEKLSYEATHDKLTGLYNRRGYDFLLKNVDLDTSALLLIDLDEFKSVNDTYGHDVGDKVLIKTSEAILKSFRAQDYVCRIGGDEFAVIMIHAEPEQSELIRKKIERINKTLLEGEEGRPAISVSAGVSFGEDARIAEVIFKEADTALYDAKNKGRQGISFYQEMQVG